MARWTPAAPPSCSLLPRPPGVLRCLAQHQSSSPLRQAPGPALSAPTLRSQFQLDWWLCHRAEGKEVRDAVPTGNDAGSTLLTAVQPQPSTVGKAWPQRGRAPRPAPSASQRGEGILGQCSALQELPGRRRAGLCLLAWLPNSSADEGAKGKSQVPPVWLQTAELPDRLLH